MESKKDIVDRVVMYLEQLASCYGTECELIKVYFFDNHNYKIKLIDKERHKFMTFEKITNHHSTGYDNGWYQRDKVER